MMTQLVGLHYQTSTVVRLRMHACVYKNVCICTSIVMHVNDGQGHEYTCGHVALPLRSSA